jgi:hypothetical protein
MIKFCSHPLYEKDGQTNDESSLFQLPGKDPLEQLHKGYNSGSGGPTTLVASAYTSPAPANPRRGLDSLFGQRPWPRPTAATPCLYPEKEPCLMQLCLLSPFLKAAIAENR